MQNDLYTRLKLVEKAMISCLPEADLYLHTCFCGGRTFIDTIQLCKTANDFIAVCKIIYNKSEGKFPSLQTVE